MSSMCEQYSTTNNFWQNKDLDKSIKIDIEALNEERFQKKIIIVKEILYWFQGYLVKLLKENLTCNDLINSDLLKTFFESEEFLENKLCFEHHVVQEKGLENISKFFFFCLNKNQEFQYELYQCMGIYIQSKAQVATNDFFKKFKNLLTFKINKTFYAIINKECYCIGSSLGDKRSFLNYDIDLILNS